ncbi:MAG TPA: hypothetical protein VLM40_21185, partial [Gemmata sp.]|nr:hypothetical protein [Gemmata sp.]
MPRRAIVFMSFLTVASGCSSPDLQDYSSTEFKFKARFVGVPKTSTKTAPFGGKIYKYSSDTGDGSLIVETIELTPAEATSDSVLQDRLDAALEQMARNYG